MKKIFKCCWNCANGFTAACESRKTLDFQAIVNGTDMMKTEQIHRKDVLHSDR